MTTTETKQTYNKLVWAKKPCPYKHESDQWLSDSVCPECSQPLRGMAGEVLVLPDLSEECKGCLYCHRHHDLESPSYCKCCRCGGTGRAPKPMHLETLIDAWRAMGYLSINTLVRGYMVSAYVVGKPINSIIEGTSVLDTTIEAIWQAVQARYPQKKKA